MSTLSKEVQDSQDLQVLTDYCSGVKTQKHTDSYYTGAACTKCGYHPQPPKSSRPLRYPEIDSTRSLFNKGHELLGTMLYATEKRDGSNLHFWLDKDGNERITSRNGPSECLTCHFTGLGDDNKASHLKKEPTHTTWRSDSCAKDMVYHAKNSKEYPKVLKMLHDNPSWNIFVELIPVGATPTQIEPDHKNSSLVLFDVAIPAKDGYYGKNHEFQFLPYRYLHQQAYHYKIPIVKQFSEGEFASMEDYEKWIADLLTYSRKHRREGVVVKKYTSPQIFVKEKVDLPERLPVKPHYDPTGVVLPPLPDSEIMGAIDKCFADNGLDFMLDKSKSMPAIVQYVRAEAVKHQMSMPTGALFNYYTKYMAGKQP